MDKHMCIMNSQADTYIEECFERKCLEYKDCKEVINQWREDKNIFSSYTAITGFDFQHYSMHDKTHSIAILRNIEMVLGRERVDQLSASNLWLLLEAAYGHDIGMSVTYEKLCKIWEDEEFRNFVEESLDCELLDRRKSAKFYEKLDALVHNRARLEAVSKSYDAAEFDAEFDQILGSKSWPVKVDRYIMMLYTEYIRKHHPKLSGEFFQVYAMEERKIPQRMYRVVENVSMLHGEEFEAVFRKTAKEENGFGAERMHPQFAAAMLRLGDLLDMDSDRFNVRMMKHMGIMPENSMLHLEKHKAMTHLSYSEGVISAEARAEDFEVCKTVNQWFHWLDEEVKNLICCWNQIVPPELHGCRLGRCDLKIYYKEKLFDANQQTKFVADSERVYKMLIGDNIYNSRLDFIREYLQNAMDASRMALWLKIKDDRELWEQVCAKTGRESAFGNKSDMDARIEYTSPYDIPLKFFEDYEIEIGAHIDWEKQELEISIQDQGIGMEKECVKAISNIAGDSWKKRRTYAKEIPYMPLWLRPTGGFGIGVQSAFMITDKVEFITRTEGESCGRRICLEGKRKGGRVSEFEEKDVKKGTKVLIRVRIMDFLEEAWKSGMELQKGISGNIYDRIELKKVVLGILEKYVSHIAAYSCFPITVRCEKDKPCKFEPKWLKLSGKMLGPRVIIKDTMGEQWTARYCVTEKQIVLWLPQRELLAICEEESEKDLCYYKGILVTNEKLESSGGSSICIIYFDKDVDKRLAVNRDRFHQQFRGQFAEDVRFCKVLFAKLLAGNVKDFQNYKLSANMALSALVYYGMGMIKLGEEAYDVLLGICKPRITIARVNTENLATFYSKSQEKFLEGFDVLDREMMYASLLESIMFKPERIALKSFIDTLKAKHTVLYSAQKEETPGRTTLHMFAQNLLEEKSEDQNLTYKDEDYIFRMLRDGDYIVTEREICKLLDWHGSKGSHVDIKEGSRYIMRIECVVISSEGEEDKVSGKGSRLREFIRDSLEKVIREKEQFPLVLCSSKIAEEDAKCGLWVKKIFGEAVLFSLDENHVINMPAEGNDELRYLILPITYRTWANIDKEARMSEEISKGMYDDIVKKEDEWKLLVEWTYCYQDSMVREGNPCGQDDIGQKQKREEIWKQYMMLLDLLYEEYFMNIM